GVKNNKRFVTVKPEDMHRGDPHADTFEAEETDTMPKVENINALCTAADDVAVIYPSKDDTEVTVDFGQIRSGFIEFELCAPAGVVIDYASYEYISAGGEIRRIDAAYSSFRYTTAKGWRRHRSPIRRGTRYGLLTFRFPKGAKEPVRIKTFRINESLFPYTHRGKFICSDYVLNDIYKMSLNTIKLCSEDTYVDCPTYEQTFWVGDSRAESLFTYYAFGEYRLAKRCFRLVAESLNQSPIAESHVPSAWRNIIPSFALLWSMGCYEYYLHSGDKDFLAEMYPAVKKQLCNIDKLFMNKDGLFEIAAWNFLDWTPMDNPNKGVVTHQNILLIRALRKAAECARILGFAKDGKEFDKRAENLAKAVNKHLKKGKTYIDSIHEDGVRSKTVSRHNQTLAYLADIIKPGEKEFFENCVERAPEGFVDVGSPFAITFVIEALLKASKPEAAIKITRDRWQVMTDNDSGSCWEMFPTHSFSNIESRSFCHAWSATPAFTLPAAVLGVTPIEPGFKKFNVKPCMETLTWAKGIVPTPYGEIVVNVRRLDGNKIAMELTVPEGTTAVAEGKELEAGIYDITLE
ncbi:MAG: hypothetical protein IJT09_06135, partial [Abditibacteriota bacterium]|nr:hypothetical protein [Abditibacteriota bacterium]